MKSVTYEDAHNMHYTQILVRRLHEERGGRMREMKNVSRIVV
jgi:hypothetical protein